jgi:hypothetical protein
MLDRFVHVNEAAQCFLGLIYCPVMIILSWVDHHAWWYTCLTLNLIDHLQCQLMGMLVDSFVALLVFYAPAMNLILSSFLHPCYNAAQ